MWIQETVNKLILKIKCFSIQVQATRIFVICNLDRKEIWWRGYFIQLKHDFKHVKWMDQIYWILYQNPMRIVYLVNIFHCSTMGFFFKWEIFQYRVVVLATWFVKIQWKVTPIFTNPRIHQIAMSKERQFENYNSWN